MPTNKRKRYPQHRPKRHRKRHLLNLNLANAAVVMGSAVLCTLALLLRLPGLQLAGLSPNWVVLWVVIWSVHHSLCQGVIGGLCLGLLQDSLTATHPTHALGLACVGLLAGRLQKQEWSSLELISAALIVFFMAGLVEVIMACQLTLGSPIPLIEIWQRLPLTALSSALWTSLWTPILYWPLNQWWKRLYPQLNREPWP